MTRRHAHAVEAVRLQDEVGRMVLVGWVGSGRVGLCGEVPELTNQDIKSF